MVDVGQLALFMSLTLALYGALVLVRGEASGNSRLVASGRGAVYALVLTTSAAVAVLVALLVIGDFRIEYVAMHTSSDLALLYKLSALWAGQEGSLLFWFWLLSLYAAALVFWRQGRIAPFVPYSAAILLGIGVFFGYMVSFVTNPFDLMSVPMSDGFGLNPLLQNPGMIWHPFTLYLGYVGLAVPFALGMSSLILGRGDALWFTLSRPWALLSWLFLSIGILTGAQWAYVELGWGGYWAWDPVENASLIPWLTATAFFHSGIIQARRGLLKRWTMLLGAATFLLTIFGTFLTRSGILESVHAFGNTGLGTYFLVFMAVIILFSTYLMLTRRELLADGEDVTAYVSKESAFLVNNLLLVGGAVAVLGGTTWPLLSEALNGEQVTLGVTFYNQVMVPVGLALLLLMGICIMLPWGQALGNGWRSFAWPLATALVTVIAVFLLENARGTGHHVGAMMGFAVAAFVMAGVIREIGGGVRQRQKALGEAGPVALTRLFAGNRRRYGGFLVHVAMALMLLGITGSSAYPQELTMGEISVGERIEFAGYEIVFQGLGQRQEGRTQIIYGDLDVFAGERRVATLQPERHFFPNEQSATEVAILGGLGSDLYVSLLGWTASGDVTLRFNHNPLVAWLWLGGWLLTAGGLLAFWPRRRDATVVVEMVESIPALAQGSGD